MTKWLKIIACVLLYFSSYQVFATETSQQYFEYLIQQKNDFSQLINDVRKNQSNLKGIENSQIKTQYDENLAKLEIVRLKIQSLQLQLNNQKIQQNRLAERIKAFQRSSTRFLSNEEVENKLSILKSEHILGGKNLVLLENNIMLAYEYESLLEQVHKELQQQLAIVERDKALANLQNEKDAMNALLIRLYAQGMQLNKNINTQQTEALRLMEEKKSLLNSQSIDLIQIRLSKNELSKKLVEAAYILQKNPNAQTLDSVSEIYKNSIHDLARQEVWLKQQLSHLMSEQDGFVFTDLNQPYQDLINEFKKQIQETAIEQQTIQEDLENATLTISKQLSTHSHFSDLHPASWMNNVLSISYIPYLFYQYIKNLTYKVYENMLWQDWFTNFYILSSVLLLLVGGMTARFYLLKKLNAITPTRLTGRVYHGLLILIHHNIPYFLCLLVLALIFYENGVDYSAYQLLFNMMGIVIFFRNLQLISKLIFFDRVSDETGHDVKLYLRIKWLLMIGGATTLLMIFGHQFPLTEFIQSVFNRLFMLFLLIVSLAIWRSKEVLMHTIVPFLKNQKGYVRRVVFVLIFLIPITLFSTALIGLLGYNNLAWNLSQYQAQFLILVAIYLLMRGLLIDVLEIFSEWMVVSLYNGWLWIEVFLKPIDKILRLGLFLAMMGLLFNIIEDATTFSIWGTITRSLHYELLNSPGIYITPASALEFLILVAVFIWLAKWTREFCYRWVFMHARDIGVRNSLSVFSQYTVIIIGSFITLRVLGFDFAGLSLVLGGLAVGMGFGLRDFANNIIGGLMLLIERPVREGDLITLGEHEGRVAHIGIRSMRVCSWDNMEVLIPNAETFNKPFINWTHQDSIVRTVIPFKVSRADDPGLVQQIISEVLALTPEVLSEPAPQVFLTQIDDALMQFEARYFINVNIHTRFEVRSKILFEITTRFKEAGIRPPIPPMQVELTNGER